MATLDKAEQLLEELRAAAYPAAQRDLDEVKAFAKEQGEQEELKWWDVAYWAERLREARYELNDEELRPYFSLPAVLDGLFKVRIDKRGGCVERTQRGGGAECVCEVRHGCFFRCFAANTSPPNTTNNL